MAAEGAKSNIQVYAIAPVAGTTMGNSAAPGLLPPSFKAEYNAPMVGLLCSDFPPSDSTGALFEIGCGWQARTRLRKIQKRPLPLESTIVADDFIGSHSLSSRSKILEDQPSKNVAIIARQESKNTDPDKTDQQILNNVDNRMNSVLKGVVFSYNKKDVLLYSKATPLQQTDIESR